MCARYSLKTNPLELQAEFELADAPTLQPRYNLAPTQAAPIITALAPRMLTIARWGLVPSWAKELHRITHTVNARAETLETKGIYKEAFARRRCLVPIDGFYEWRREGKVRHPLHITLPSHRPFSLGGLWETWRSPEGLELVSFTIITTGANDFMRGIHDRMPLVIAPEDRRRWLEDDAHARELLRPWEGPLASLAVSHAVNKVANDDARCLEPATTGQLSLL